MVTMSQEANGSVGLRSVLKDLEVATELPDLLASNIPD